MPTAVVPLVFVVDDSPSVRKSLDRLLGSAGYAVETFASAGEFLARAPSDGPCCLVLDVRMPGLTGIEMQEALVAAGSQVSIIFITGHVDVRTSVKAMRAGAVDLLTKPIDQDELLAAIARAVTQDTARRSEAARIAEIRQRLTTLTARETQVFVLVVTGMLNKQIAGELGIGEKTIKVHRGRVMDKMRAGSIAELVRLADALGVIVGTPATSGPAAREHGTKAQQS